MFSPVITFLRKLILWVKPAFGLAGMGTWASIVCAIFAVLTYFQTQFPVKTGPSKIASASSSDGVTQATPDMPAAHARILRPPRYINEALLAGDAPINAVAVLGKAETVQGVLEALALPLRQGVFTPAFFKDGLFERALQGDGDAIFLLDLHKRVGKIVLIRAGDRRMTDIPDGQGAKKVSADIKVAVLDAQSGTLLKSASFTAEGAGFSEKYWEEALHNEIANKLAPVRDVLSENSKN
jgi:hypothetical protein